MPARKNSEHKLARTGNPQRMTWMLDKRFDHYYQAGEFIKANAFKEDYSSPRKIRRRPNGTFDVMVGREVAK